MEGPRRLIRFLRAQSVARGRRAAAFGVAVGLAFVAVFWAVALRTTENARDIESQARVSRLVCVESNKLRDAERGLWELIIQLSAQNPNPNVSKAARDKQLAAFRAYINTAFAHIDCNAAAQAQGGAGSPPAIAFPVVTRVVENTKTKTRTVYITVPTTVLRTRVVCRLPNGRRCP